MERTITVKGVGTVSASPDNIEIYITLNARKKDYKTAVENANQKFFALESELKNVGYEKGSLKTLSFNVHAAYEYQKNERVFAGYDVSYCLRLDLNMDKGLLARTMDALSGCDADAALDIKFTAKNKEALKAALLRSAAENAKKNAAILCEASGVTLGQLVKINYSHSEPNFCSPTAYSTDNALRCAKGAAPEITADDIKLTDSAEFVWEIS